MTAEVTIRTPTCAECGGQGTHDYVACAHGGSCPCDGYRVREECPGCGGTGRICPDCHEPMALGEPREAVRCSGCVEAEREAANA